MKIRLLAIVAAVFITALVLLWIPLPTVWETSPVPITAAFPLLLPITQPVT